MEFLAEIKTLQNIKHSLERDRVTQSKELMEHYDLVISYVHEVSAYLSKYFLFNWFMTQFYINFNFL
jgi:hypothetical protein